MALETIREIFRMKKTPAAATKTKTYTPYDYDRGFPDREIRIIELDDPEMKIREEVYYKNDKGHVTAAEIRDVTKKGKRIMRAQFLYSDARKDRPNWKYFQNGKLFESGLVVYNALGEIVDGFYHFSRPDGTTIQRNYFKGNCYDIVKKTYESGDAETACYIEDSVTGKTIKNGPAFYHFKDGSVETCMYIKGVAQGKAKLVHADKSIEHYTYKDGVIQGNATRAFSDGSVLEYIYESGTAHGQAVCRSADGSVENYRYQYGVMRGEAVKTMPNGDVEKFTYEDGIEQGLATTEFPDGAKQTYTYKDGKRQGKALQENESGTALQYWYVDGKAEGLCHFFDEQGNVVLCGVYIMSDLAISFSPDKDVRQTFDETLKDISVPARDIGTLYREALDEMNRQYVDQNDIMEIYDRMRPQLEQVS